MGLRRDFNLILAENGDIGFLRLLRNPETDVVIMDYEMPPGHTGNNGAEVVKKMREELEYKGIILALTTHAEEKVENEFKEAGANYFFTKPFKPFEIRVT